MDKIDLLKQIKTIRDKVKVPALTELAANGDFAVLDLLKLCYYSEKAIAFRAAWVLEMLERQSPSLFIPVLEVFIADLAKQNNKSCQRHFSKIIIQYTKPKAGRIRKKAFDNLPLAKKEQVVAILFEWLIKPGSPVAVQVNCMEALYYLIPYFPWIKEELMAQIMFYLKDGTAAMQSRGKKLLHNLQEAR
ncbi:hypothetical protein GCM10023231_06630 [Olivibacter ginsenosidimutans]|uniref:Adenylosuccinate lyase n=1 Tax=Olivibacter ginsenosidimutans TaxID=1176537 RepID=A0ABP9AHT4_9SPHI